MHQPNAQLYTIAFPDLAPDATAFVERIRSVHGGDQRTRIAPHFTLVFGSSLMRDGDYVQHVAEVAINHAAIDFTCRCATLGSDAETDKAYVFLVPDEGFAAMARLHDDLYSGPLASAELLEHPYVPHITVGVMDDRCQAKSLCRQLNASGVRVSGRLATLAIGAMGAHNFEVRARVALGSPLPSRRSGSP